MGQAVPLESHLGGACFAHGINHQRRSKQSDTNGDRSNDHLQRKIHTACHVVRKQCHRALQTQTSRDQEEDCTDDCLEGELVGSTLVEVSAESDGKGGESRGDFCLCGSPGRDRVGDHVSKDGEDGGEDPLAGVGFEPDVEGDCEDGDEEDVPFGVQRVGADGGDGLRGA